MDLFSRGLVGKIIEGFPYPEKFCHYCDQPLKLQKAIHVSGSEEIFKAVFFCLNSECEVFDEPAKKAYALVVYSCEEAYKRLELERIFLSQPVREILLRNKDS